MAKSLNRVDLIGRLGKDPEQRAMQSGDTVVSFSLATSETWKDKQGNRQEKTQWHNCVSFNQGLNKVLTSYVKKGSQIMVTGALEHSSYEKDGVTKYKTEVVLRPFDSFLQLLDSKSEANEGATSSQSSQQAPSTSDWQAPDDFSDEVPF